MTRYIFRLDDIAPTMNWARYFEVSEVFARHGVKPLLGVIPDNQDEQLLSYPSCSFEFWEHLRLRMAQGWEIALHGFQHRFVTNQSGILGINARSEFAGLSVAEQVKKLRMGLRILRDQGLETHTFMPPAHSYDSRTLEAMRIVGLEYISDGLSLYPYRLSGIIHVPQQLAVPRQLPFGVFTFCLHVNEMTCDAVSRVERFLGRHSSAVVSFKEGAKFVHKPALKFPTALCISGFRKVRGLGHRGASRVRGWINGD